MLPGLKQSVVDNLPDIFAAWEGRGLTYPYTDSKGLVTTGTGNLIEPVARALVIPWWMPDGSRATTAQIATDWERVKAAYPAVQSTKCAPLTSIRLHADGLAALMIQTIANDWHILSSFFPGFETWPADAQLALLSIAWAWGAGFVVVWNKIGGAPLAYGDAFKLQCATPDFELAAGVMKDASAHEEKINRGIIPRDAGEVVMFRNAQAVVEAGADRDRLWYPATFQAAA